MSLNSLTYISEGPLSKLENDIWVVVDNDVLERYKLRRRIGQGSFGVVYIAEDRESIAMNKNVVIKIIDITREDIDRESIYKEIAILNILSTPGCNPNITCIYDSYIDDVNAYIVMEYVRGENLYHFMTRNDRLIAPTILWDLMKQLLTGLSYIHSRGIIHKDIKLENILYDEDNNLIKYLDFGLSCLFRNNITYRYTCTYSAGTATYLSPETFDVLYGSDIQPTFENGVKQDIWALGVVFYELANKRDTIPNIAKMDFQTIARTYHKLEDEGREGIETSNYPLDAPGVPYHDVINQIIDNMLTFDPDKRMSLASIITYVYDMEEDIDVGVRNNEKDEIEESNGMMNLENSDIMSLENSDIMSVNGNNGSDGMNSFLGEYYSDTQLRRMGYLYDSDDRKSSLIW